MKKQEEPVSVTPENKQHWLELRSKNLNSTDVSALFGVNPYLTEFELWHRLKEPTVQEFASTERMSWGNALEAAIANEAARVNGWTIEPFKDYWYLPESRLGSSFDFALSPINGVYSTLLEVKNVDTMAYNKNWIEHSDDDIEAPPHIELQVQHQMLITGFSTVYICALVGGNTLKVLKREVNPSIQDMILKKSAKFWESIDSGVPPKINYERDSEFLIDLYNHAEPNKVLDAKSDYVLDALVSGYNTVSAGIKELETQKDMWKAKILEHISDNEKVLGSNYTISAGITPECPVSFVRKSFRNFRITNKKQQAKEQ